MPRLSYRPPAGSDAHGSRAFAVLVWGAPAKAPQKGQTGCGGSGKGPYLSAYRPGES